MSGTAKSVRAYPGPELKKRGFDLTVEVALDGDTLFIRGGSELVVPIARIERLQVAQFFDSQTRYVSKVWVTGEAAPIELQQCPGDWSYGPLIRDLAAWVASRRGLAAVRAGGTGARNWILLFIICGGIPAFAITFLMRFQWNKWLVAALAAVAAALCAPIVWRIIRDWRPRPIQALSDLDRQLPVTPDWVDRPARSST